MHIPNPHELLRKIIAWRGADWRVVGKFSCPCGFRGGPRNIQEHRAGCPTWLGYVRVSWRNYFVSLKYHPKPMWHPMYPDLSSMAETHGIHHPDFITMQEKVIWPWCQSEVWTFVRYDHDRNMIIVHDGIGERPVSQHMVEPIPS